LVDGRRIKTLPAVFKMGSVLDLLHNLLTACFKTYFAVMQVTSLATSSLTLLVGLQLTSPIRLISSTNALVDGHDIDLVSQMHKRYANANRNIRSILGSWKTVAYRGNLERVERNNSLYITGRISASFICTCRLLRHYKVTVALINDLQLFIDGKLKTSKIC